MQFINANIPDTILGKDGKTLYKLVHISGSCYNVVEIVYPVPAHPVPQSIPSTPAHPGKKNWQNKGPRSHNGNQSRGPQPLNQAGATSTSKKENDVIVLKSKQPAQGNQSRGTQPLNQASVTSTSKKENKVIVLKPIEPVQPAQQQPKSGAPKKRYYNRGPKKAPAASAASQEAVVPQEQVPEKVVEEKVADVTVAVPSDC